MRDKAIRNTHPTVISIRGESDARDVNRKVVVLNESLVTAEIIRLKAEYDAKKYQRDRAEEYPSIADQLDDLYHNGIDGWKTTIKAIKDKHPKE